MQYAVIKADVPAMAAGLYEMFDENMQAVCAFGMLPAPLMRMVDRLLGEKFDELNDSARQAIADGNEVFGEDCPSLQSIVDDLAKQYDDRRKRFIRETAHQVAVAIYGEAAKAGKMVV